MEAEKVHQEKVARTIQQMHEGGGTAQFADNRPTTVAGVLQQQPAQRVGPEEEEDTLQGKFEGTVQRAEEEDERLQMKADATGQRKPNNTGLPDHLKAGVENLSGFSMDDVNVHYNSPQPATVQALAYTQGANIYVAPGQEQHLPHEAWHVAQQMAGRVEPTTQAGGLPVNDNAGLEQEADVMGSQANNL